MEEGHVQVRLGHSRPSGRDVALLAAALVTGLGSAAVAEPANGGVVNPDSAIRVVRAELIFSGRGKAGAKTFVVSQPWYTRTFNAASTTCGAGDAAIARFTPTAWAGPTATFSVTPLNAGTCTITVDDDNSGSVRVTIIVLAANPKP